ncbi:o-succinylbenzoate--CoA ligase [Corynebacterium sp. 3HC-13]|uniref:o-succinylbenzoate--CoA ligase n=1 Tax=Corynebacterium poyangense TaxID=2684405 RepID=UPI001CCA61FF|nr:o-succinylbenzoate--CoA ligase [Corynebacterium poyangense]MBZ8177653.1 o-succinylbenzoate--CoA ligase [Corynebacterium poyangense]
MTRLLEPLYINPHCPEAVLDDLEQAIAGQRTLLPLPGGHEHHDRSRATLLRNSQRVGKQIDSDIALVVATSGSTGTPKGALLSPSNLVSSADATHRVLGGEGNWLLAMPAHHIAGIQVLVRSLIAGVQPLCLDLSQGFDIPEFLRSAQELCDSTPGERRYTALTPMQLLKALDSLSGIEALRLFDHILIGGAELRTDVRRSAHNLGINLISTYGSSETSGGCVYDGHPLPGARLKVEAGRIFLGGPMVAHGYRNHPHHEAFAQPGWFATSDGGVIDSSGTLHVHGRLDAVIDSGGLKLHPEVVERQILEHPKVSAACIVGVPDPRLGQRIVGAYQGEATPDEVYEHLCELPRWQIPKELRRVTQLPLTGPGKIDRQAVAGFFC